MLLFYTFFTLQASAEASHDPSNRFIILTTTDNDQPIMALSDEEISFSKIISDMIQSEENDGDPLSSEIKERFKLPDEATGWVIPLFNIKSDLSFLPYLESLTPYLQQLKSVQEKEYTFVKILRNLINNGPSMPGSESSWDFEKRVKLLEFFQYLNLQFKGNDRLEIMLPFLKFDLSHMTGKDLLNLQTSSLQAGDICVVINTFKEFEDWVDKQAKEYEESYEGDFSNYLKSIPCEIKGALDNEQLIKLSEFLKKFNITAEIKGKGIGIDNIALIKQMMTEGKIKLQSAQVSKVHPNVSKAITSILNKNSSVTISRYFKRKSTKALSLALKDNTTLKTLCLMDIAIEANEAKNLAHILNNTAVEVLRLIFGTITLSGVEILSEALRYNTTLKKLSFIMSGMGNHNKVITLARGLRGNTTLKILQLCNDYISSEKVENLIDALKDTAIETLDLSYNSVDDTGAMALARNIKSNKTIKTLTLCKNNIGEKGKKALNDAVEEELKSGREIEIQFEE